MKGAMRKIASESRLRVSAALHSRIGSLLSSRCIHLAPAARFRIELSPMTDAEREELIALIDQAIHEQIQDTCDYYNATSMEPEELDFVRDFDPDGSLRELFDVRRKIAAGFATGFSACCFGLLCSASSMHRFTHSFTHSPYSSS